MTVRINYGERKNIELWLRAGVSRREIARRLGRHHSDIDAEYARNMDQGYLPYNARRAQLRAQAKAHHTNKRKLDKDPLLRKYVVDSLLEGWSPEQIVGRLREFPPKELKDASITVETIYQFVYARERDNNGKLLYHHLRRSSSKRIKRYARKPSKIKIPERVSIHERPVLEGYGHWETDSLFGKRNQPISVQYEKKSQLVRLHRLANRTATENREAIADTLDLLPQWWEQTVTFDNGTENTEHNQLGVKTYFCDPYKAWQKGGVENMNGLIRQYIPKGYDLNQLNDLELHHIQEALNNRPRKGLHYRSPNEIFKQVAG